MILKIEFPSDVEYLQNELYGCGYYVMPDKICEFWRWFSQNKNYAKGKNGDWFPIRDLSCEEIFRSFEDWCHLTVQEVRVG